MLVESEPSADQRLAADPVGPGAGERRGPNSMLLAVRSPADVIYVDELGQSVRDGDVTGAGLAPVTPPVGLS